MRTIQVRILDPKATKLLQDLADKDLIAIEQEPAADLRSVVERLRKKASATPPTSEEIIKEVEVVRAKRYARKKA
jgi:hypothetical protein